MMSVATTRAPPRNLALPYIEDKLLLAVQTRTKYVELARLLPQQRGKPETSLTKISMDEEGDTTVASSRPTANILSIAQWCQAFAAFAGYHSFYFPELSMGLWSYMGFITGKLGGFPLDMCLDYDAEFRKRIARYPDTMRWEMPDRDIMDQTFRAPSIPANLELSGHSGSPGGSRSSAHTVVQPSSGFQGGSRHSAHTAVQPNSSQLRSEEVCRKFQGNHCPTPCQYGRLHVCSVCRRHDHNGMDHFASFGQPTQNQQRQIPRQPKNFPRRM